MLPYMLIPVLVGCATSDPARNEAASYINDVQPLMLENRHLSERRLQLAARIYNDDIDGDELAKRWAEEIVPLARHLYIQAKLVEPPEAWQEMHSTLVATWSDRSTAYTEMSEALATVDKERWEEARKLHNSVIKREEQWFASVRTRLAPFELQLDPYP